MVAIRFKSSIQFHDCGSAKATARSLAGLARAMMAVNLPWARTTAQARLRLVLVSTQVALSAVCRDDAPMLVRTRTGASLRLSLG
jgi:hypothetical protein